MGLTHETQDYLPPHPLPFALHVYACVRVLLHLTCANNATLSFILFVSPSSARTWSYSFAAEMKMMLVMFSKQWIHFRRSDRCPPTSSILPMQAQRGWKEGE